MNTQKPGAFVTLEHSSCQLWINLTALLQWKNSKNVHRKIILPRFLSSPVHFVVLLNLMLAAPYRRVVACAVWWGTPHLADLQQSLAIISEAIAQVCCSSVNIFQRHMWAVLAGISSHFLFRHKISGYYFQLREGAWSGKSQVTKWDRKWSHGKYLQANNKNAVWVNGNIKFQCFPCFFIIIT